MAEIPDNPLTTQLIGAWYKLAEQLKKLKSSEYLMRQEIFKKAFPKPKEGTNNYGLDDGYVLKGNHVLNRNIDEGAFKALKEQLLEAEVKIDDLVEYKPSLVKREYNKLTESQRKIFDQCLVIKPGSPSLEVVLPAKAKKAKEALPKGEENL